MPGARAGEIVDVFVISFPYRKRVVATSVRFPPIPAVILALRTSELKEYVEVNARRYGMRPFTTVTAAIFLLMAVVHLYRIAVGFPITIGGANVGQEVSWVAIVVTLVLAVGLFREARRR